MAVVLPPLGDDDLPLGWPHDHGIASLGPDVLSWAETYLVQPDGDGAGGPWRWTSSQARFVAWWYALDGARFVFHKAQVVLPKGAGKSPMAAALACVELAGPVILDGLDASGVAVGRPHPSPDVQLAAVSREQADNTMSLAIAMLTNKTALHVIPGLDVGLSRIRVAGGRLRALTASARSAEGHRATAAVLDETHLWEFSNGGKRLADTIRRNLGKTDGRSIETTNTWVPGGGSVAEDTYDNIMRQRAGLTWDSKERVLRWHPKARVDDLGEPDQVRSALQYLYHDSPWVNVDRLMAEIYDLGMDPRDATRFYLNQITEASDSWLSDSEVAACADGVPASDGEQVVLGFDGSRGRTKGKPDATALIGCTMAGATLFELGVWEASEDTATWSSWQPSITDIEATIADAFERFDVRAFLCDPARDWRSHINAWESRWGSRVAYKASFQHPFEWWMTGGRSILVERAVEALEGAFRNRDVHHLGEVQLVRHLLNARRRISHGRLALGKESPHSGKKIDAAVAAVLAWQARTDALTAGIKTPQKPVRVTFIPSRVR